MGEFKNTRKTHHITFDDADVNQQNPLKMTNNRNIIQLLQILKEHIIISSDYWDRSSNLWVLTFKLYFDGGLLSRTEVINLFSYLELHEPTYIYGSKIDFFEPGLSKPQLKWLNEQIQRLQKEQKAL